MEDKMPPDKASAGKISTAEIASEYLGSLILLIAAISPIILFESVFESHIGLALFANAVAVTFVLYALIEIFKPVSGAHFNPLVTIITLFEKKISGLKTFLYILFQTAGGISGVICSHIMFYKHIDGLVFISQIRRNDYAYFSEFLCAFILILAVFMPVRTDSKKSPFIIPLLVGGMVLSTSSFMFANPQVTIARIFTNSITGISPQDCAVFILMQLFGMFSAYAVCKFVFNKK